MMTIPRGEIHVWTAGLALPPHVIETLAETLAPDERARVARFVFPEHRSRSIAARGLLRRLLGRYLNRDPGSIRIAYGEHGKPGLEGSELSFNLSHSADLVVFALSADGPVGIDAERVEANSDHLEIAKRHFSASEISALESVPATELPEAFFRTWTRKEAFVKARGEGLSIALDSFSALGDAFRPKLSVEGWSLVDLVLAPGYVGAVAFPGSAVVRCFDLRCDELARVARPRGACP